jgi:hypothetical protein
MSAENHESEAGHWMGDASPKKEVSQPTVIVVVRCLMIVRLEAVASLHLSNRGPEVEASLVTAGQDLLKAMAWSTAVQDQQTEGRILCFAECFF